MGAAAVSEPQSDRAVKQNAAYHLSEDLADNAISWLRHHEAFAPDRPFFMYWASGAAHGPHHVFKDWADKYTGKFDDGWDDYRERVFARQKATGWIPAEAELTPRAETMQGWADIPEAQRPFQRRLMEVFAGYLEHVDVQVGRVLDELDRLGRTDNTLVFYIFGDNGSSAEGQTGSISELLAQNGIPDHHRRAIGRTRAARWPRGAGDHRKPTTCTTRVGRGRAIHRFTTPSWWRVISAAPVIRWRRMATADRAGRDGARPVPPRQRHRSHHLRDPRHPATPLVDGHEQKPIDGVSLAYTFDNPDEPTRKKVQYFENNASRGIYRDGWFACAFGPFVPWDTAGTAARFANWDANTEPWELYHLDEDFSQANDLAAVYPDKLDELKTCSRRCRGTTWCGRSERGCGYGSIPRTASRLAVHAVAIRRVVHPDAEFTAPGLGRQDSHVEIALTVPDSACGVLYALGGFSGGLTLFMDSGFLVYGYNMMIIDRFQARSVAPIPPGEHVITVDTRFDAPQPMSPATVTLKVDGNEVGNVVVARTAPGAFTASETFGVGVDLGSPGVTGLLRPTPVPFHRHHRPRRRRSVATRQGRLTWGHCGPAWLRSSSPAR